MHSTAGYGKIAIMNLKNIAKVTLSEHTMESTTNANIKGQHPHRVLWNPSLHLNPLVYQTSFSYGLQILGNPPSE